MKKTLSLLMVILLSVTCFITGCSAARQKSTTDNSTVEAGLRKEDATQLKNIGRMKNHINIDNYITRHYEGKDSDNVKEFKESFQLRKYLIDNGATNLWFFQNDDSFTLTAKFNNGLIVVMEFGGSSLTLGNVLIMASRKGYVPGTDALGFYFSTDRSGSLSEWERVIDFTDIDSIMGEEDYLDNHDYPPEYEVVFQDHFKILQFLHVRDYFDLVFKRTIRPYIEQGKLSLKTDPFADDLNMYGEKEER